MFKMSIKNDDLKPILIGLPSYWHINVSSAEVEKSMSCAEMLIWFSFRLSLMRLLACDEKTDTRRSALINDARSTMALCGLFCGMT